MYVIIYQGVRHSINVPVTGAQSVISTRQEPLFATISPSIAGTTLPELFVRIIFEGPVSISINRTPTAVPIMKTRTMAEDACLLFVLGAVSDCPPWRGVDSPSSIVTSVIVTLAEYESSKERRMP